MPLDHIDATAQRIWGFWKIAEDEKSLASAVPEEKITTGIANQNKRLEFLAGRVLIKSLLKHWNLPYNGLTKDVYGKPFLSNSTLNISLTHSFPYVAAILHRNKNVGIDLEQPKNKLLTIAPRVLAEAEIKDAGTDIVKHCIYWCAKECLIKIYGKKDLILAKQLLITPFLLGKKGYLIGRIIANKSETAIPLHYIVYDNFVVVVSK
jgi:phosphopantetheinyl transferase